MKIQVIAFLALCSAAYGQINKSLAEVEKILGSPASAQNAPTVARIYIKDKLKIQVNFENNIAITAVYKPIEGKLTDQLVSAIYTLNGISNSDIVDMDPPDLKEVKGVYKRTQDRKIAIMDDRAKNTFALYESKILLRMLGASAAPPKK